MDFQNIPRPKVVFSDFDGTLTVGCELTSTFYAIMELLKENNIPLVIVTGRSKSWAHFLLSHFSYLEHVITEGGGVLSGKDLSTKRSFKMWDKLLLPTDEVERLTSLVQVFKEKFPHAEMSLDSFGRETDRAIELTYLLENPEENEKIRAFLTENNINFSTSNIHLNFWCGTLSKMESINYFLQNYMPNVALKESIFFGDSLNDESVFKEHPNSVGVSNVEKVLHQLNHPPKTILKGTDKEGALGVLSYLEEVLK